MEWNDGMENGMEQWTYTVALTGVTGAAQARLNYLSHRRSFMSNYGIAHRAPSCFYILAYAWCRCWLIIGGSVIIVLQSETLERKTKVSKEKQGSGFTRLWYSLGRQTWMCLMAKISARSSVSSLWSLSVHLDPPSLLGLITLVAAFLNSSKCGSYAWYCSLSLGTMSSDHDIMHDTRQRRILTTCTGLAHTASAVR